jgi:lipopolysaccharide export system protein LptA
LAQPGWLLKERTRKILKPNNNYYRILFMLIRKHFFYILTLILVSGLMVPGLGICQGLLDKGGDQKKDKPIEIVSDRMRSEEGGEKIIFSGNVIGTWGELTITSDILEIYNSKETTNQTDEIVAIGNVIITKDKKRAKGDRAVYLDKLQKIILTGKPHATAWEEKNIIEGKEMIFLLDQDRFVVNKRVRMKLFPKKKQTQARTNDDKEGNNKVWVDAKK